MTTKVYALVDAHGLPVVFKLTKDQAHDGISAADMLAGLRPRQILLARQSLDSNGLRQNSVERGIAKRLPAASRSLVERLFNILKHYQSIAARCEKHAASFLALIKLAATRIWLRAYRSAG